MSNTHNSDEVKDSDLYFLIDTFTRAITYEGDNPKLTLIQGDHNSERLTFDIYQFVETHDMSTCNKVEVHFINIGSGGERSTGMYKITDLREDDDNPNHLICSWLVSREATKYVGTLNFVIRFACTAGDRVSYVWSTAVYSGINISAGIDNSDDIVEQYSDVLEKWYLELINAGNMGVNIVADATDEATQKIAATADDYIANTSTPQIEAIVREKASEVSEDMFLDQVMTMVDPLYVHKDGYDNIEITNESPSVTMRNNSNGEEDIRVASITANSPNIYGDSGVSIKAENVDGKGGHLALSITPGNRNIATGEASPTVSLIGSVDGKVVYKNLIDLSDIPIAKSGALGLVKAAGDISVDSETGSVTVKNAAQATKAQTDWNGKVIHETYATKDDIPEVAESAKVATSVDVTAQRMMPATEVGGNRLPGATLSYAMHEILLGSVLFISARVDGIAMAKTLIIYIPDKINCNGGTIIPGANTNFMTFQSAKVDGYYAYASLRPASDTYDRFDIDITVTKEGSSTAVVDAITVRWI